MRTLKVYEHVKNISVLLTIPLTEPLAELLSDNKTKERWTLFEGL